MMLMMVLLPLLLLLMMMMVDDDDVNFASVMETFILRSMIRSFFAASQFDVGWWCVRFDSVFF
jgi:hypothetical protein